ncbi:MAG: ABC transporter substrate-binding protein [Polymorphobacter sp.]
MRFPLPVAALLLAACGQSGPEGSRLTVTVIGDPERPAGLARRLVAEATQPTLVARDGAGQTVAGLATSWRFVDGGRSLILRLRPQKWRDGKALDSGGKPPESSGKPLVSGDVVAALRRAAVAREPALATAGITGAADIAARRAGARQLGVRAPISRVVEVRLDAASPLLLGWLAEPGLGVTSPRKGATLSAYDLAGTPQRRVLTRASMTSSPEAQPAQIVIAGTDNIGAALADFAAGRTDVVIGDGLAGLGEARITARGDTLRIDPLWGVYGYIANGMRGPTANPAVRRALALAVDRPALTAALGLAAVVPVAGLLPPALGGTALPPRRLGGAIADTDAKAARLVQARQALAEAGWTAENPLRLVLLLPPGRVHHGIAERVAADWSRIGVLLAATQVDGATYDRLLARGDFDLAVTEASLPVPDAAALLARWRCGIGVHCNPVADALLAQARTAAPGDRPALLARAESEYLTGPPLIPLFTPLRWALVGRHVDGWTANPAGSHPLARLSATGRR